MVQESHLLLNPLFEKLDAIQEDITNHSREIRKDQLLDYGNFEKALEVFRVDQLRLGSKKVNEVDFFNFLLKEISEIENFLIRIEKEGIIKSDNLHGRITILRKQIKRKLAKYKKTVLKSNVKAKSFGLLNSDPAKVRRLHMELIQGGFIEKGIDFNDFMNAFSDPIISPSKPIMWLKTIQDLAYLFECLSKGEDVSGVFSLIEAYKVFSTKRNPHLKRNNIDTAKNRYKNIDPPQPVNGYIIEEIVWRVKKIN